MRVVLDTNVVVSALLSPFGAPASILNTVFTRDIALLYDDRIMLEYKDVLARKKFGFDRESVNRILDYIFTVGERVLASPLKIKLRDPFDLPFAEVAVSGHADALVTGNKKHFPKSIPISIMTPSEFLERI